MIGTEEQLGHCKCMFFDHETVYGYALACKFEVPAYPCLIILGKLAPTDPTPIILKRMNGPMEVTSLIEELKETVAGLERHVAVLEAKQMANKSTRNLISEQNAAYQRSLEADKAKASGSANSTPTLKPTTIPTSRSPSQGGEVKGTLRDLSTLPQSRPAR